MLSINSDNNNARILIKFMFSQKASKIDEIFTVDLTLCSKRQIDGEGFVNFRGLLRKYELYKSKCDFKWCHNPLCMDSSGGVRNEFLRLSIG